ncbi:MAG: hypothetical protein HOA17_03765 [Candidatus Melainabacteria bacterium]|jgi:hypothetical protein|nr:hypothetical protein [Candidatus Melainabacteria bacterium]
MKNDDKIQIPLNSQLKDDFKDKCENIGFSSVNEALRVLIHNFTYNNNITLQLMNLNTKPIPQNLDHELLDKETDRRLDEAYQAIKDGEYTAVDSSKSNWLKRHLES